MAFCFSPSIIFFISLLTLTIQISTCYDFQPESLIHIHLYAHEIFTGVNATVMPVAMMPQKEIDIVNIPLTKGPNPKSKLLGRAQGVIALVSGHPTNTLYVSCTIVFTQGAYKKSTLAVSGLVEDARVGKVYYWSVIGGTEMLTWARGYVCANVSSIKPGYELLDVDIYLRVG